MDIRKYNFLCKTYEKYFILFIHNYATTTTKNSQHKLRFLILFVYLIKLQSGLKRLGPPKILRQQFNLSLGLF